MSQIGAWLVADLTYQSTPEQMGTPAPGQMQGTSAERLIEAAGRVCYDSLGKGRNTPEYMRHILEVGHLSVCEHAHMTLLIEDQGSVHGLGVLAFLPHLLNRYGVYTSIWDAHTLRVTLNFRAALEWDRWSEVPGSRLVGGTTLSDARTKSHLKALEQGPQARDLIVTYMLANPTVARSIMGHGMHESAIDVAGYVLASAVRQFGQMLAPLLFGSPSGRTSPGETRAVYVDRYKISYAAPLVSRERFVSLFMSGSRGFSHEQVRHRGDAAVSQRSTRYVDESESLWVTHPLFRWLLPDFDWNRLDVVREAKAKYARLVESLQSLLEAKGADRLTARKQARGAARGVLGNALHTEMILTASVAQWRWMLHQRASAGADAEIRCIYAGGPMVGEWNVLAALRSSVFGMHFEDIIVSPSPDGVGNVVKVPEYTK
jgi:thymidylate synthase ThyX